MKQIFCAVLRGIACVAVCVTFVGCRTGGVDSARVKSLFGDPPREYASAPLWVWNDMLTEEQISSTLRDLAGQKVKQVFVHPRPGLMTPYLSDDWFRLWRVALKEAERLDMNIWIYDENSYPSGFAGGFVPEAMPESRGKGLYMREEKQAPKWSDEIVGVYRLDDDGYENVTEKIRAGEKMGESLYLVAFLQWAKHSPWFGGKYYVDLMKPGVTEKFLEITMGAYSREIGDQFGKRVPGVFTDEPHLRPARGHPWTDDLPEVFERRWGYHLTEYLPSLVQPVGDWKRVRHNYFAVLLELYIDRWAKPYYEYCERRGLEFTGHYWEHGWPKCTGVPDNMALSAWQQRPGIDTLFNRYSEGTKAQFGNIRAVKELASVANQLGRRRTLCEAYGGGGWDLRFEDMKRIGDWLYVLGVNTLNEHLSHITIRGARKADYPQSFSYHEPWWEAYHVMAGYFTRLSAVLSQGEQVNTILIIEPTTTAWMYQEDPSHSEHLAKIGDEFQRLVVVCAKAQVEYDIGCEDIIARHGSVKGKVLKVGNRRYETVVLPALTENLDSKTMSLLEAYAKAGGKVLCCGRPPTTVDGLPSDRGKLTALNSGWERVKADAVAAMLLSRSKDGFAIRQEAGDKGILLHHRRALEDGEILFLVNTSIDTPTSGQIESAMRGVEQWNPETSAISPYPFIAKRDGIRASFKLAPCGSLLLFLSKKAVEPGAAGDSVKSSTVSPVGPCRIRPLESNVLTLDYVDVTAGGEAKQSVHFYEGARFAFQKNGMDNNPWDHAVQFRDELISKTFPRDSGFEASYHFTIEGRVPDPLYIVIERPDLYTVTCNQTTVAARRGIWWLDKAFGKIDITSSAKVGENTVTIKASPFSIYHELSPAYVLGDFTLRAADSGFVIVPEVPLELGRWNEQGRPLYAAGVSYTQNFEVSEVKGRYYVRLPDWYGSVARVTVNGKRAGYIHHRPWEYEVTEYIAKGTNGIEVLVFGTLKNTLGPHHGNPRLGYASPGSFRKGPTPGPPAGQEYHTVGYGLFKPFELLNRRPGT